MVRGMARGRHCSPPVSAAVLLQAQVGLTQVTPICPHINTSTCDYTTVCRKQGAASNLPFIWAGQ